MRETSDQAGGKRAYRMGVAVAVVTSVVVIVGRRSDAVVTVAGGAHLPLQALAVLL